MRYLPRHIESRLTRLARRFPVIMVGGARQSGKSTLLARLFGARTSTFVFDPVTDVGNARRDPELFLVLNPPPLVLDEVQYAAELLPVLKRFVDEHGDTPGQYFLTGSQQFKVLSRVQESLAGRVLLTDLYPMTRAELLDAHQTGIVAALFSPTTARDSAELVERLRAMNPHREWPATSLYEWLYRGGYPGLLSFATDEVAAWFGSYLRTYVERDVRTLRDIGSPQDFTRFFRLMAALTAQEVNASHLGREIGITPNTARAWLDALGMSYQVALLPAFSGNTVKRLSGRPKAHIVDTGFACHLLSISTPGSLAYHPVTGALFETYVVTEIIKAASSLDVHPNTWCWRTTGGAEIDLILERDGAFALIEAKLTSRPSRRDTRGLRSFSETYPHLRLGPRIIVHGGRELYLVDEDTAAVPWYMV